MTSLILAFGIVMAAKRQYIGTWFRDANQGYYCIVSSMRRESEDRLICRLICLSIILLLLVTALELIPFFLGLGQNFHGFIYKTYNVNTHKYDEPHRCFLKEQDDISGYADYEVFYEPYYPLAWRVTIALAAIAVGVLFNLFLGCLREIKAVIGLRNINLCMLIIYGALTYCFFMLNLTVLKVIDWDSFRCILPFGNSDNEGCQKTICMARPVMLDAENGYAILWGMALAVIPVLWIVGLVLKCILFSSMVDSACREEEAELGLVLFFSIPLVACVSLMLTGLALIWRINVANRIQYDMLAQFLESPYYFKLQVIVTSATWAFLLFVGVLRICCCHEQWVDVERPFTHMPAMRALPNVTPPSGFAIPRQTMTAVIITRAS
eukprot:g69790.t1